MLFADISGHSQLKKNLIHSAQQGRISHAQLFHGAEGSAAFAMALAYAQYVSCTDKSDNDSCGNCISCKQFKALSYPDLHFVFPFPAAKKGSKYVSINEHMGAWTDFIKEDPHFNLLSWLEKLGMEKKQGLISVRESAHILKTLSLKSYAGDYKFMIIWLPEKLHPSAANKLLKIIEEPLEKTLLLLVSAEPEQLLQTIISRCQQVFVPKYSAEDIQLYLSKQANAPSANDAEVIAKLANGNMNTALLLNKQADAFKGYATLFLEWARMCVKPNLIKILEWVDLVSKMDREKQKNFIRFCASIFSDSFHLNYGVSLNDKNLFKDLDFNTKGFARFTHLKNTPKIIALLDKAYYDISRNGNPKIIFTDTSLDFARFLNIKP